MWSRGRVWFSHRPASTTFITGSRKILSAVTHEMISGYYQLSITGKVSLLKILFATDLKEPRNITDRIQDLADRLGPSCSSCTFTFLPRPRRWAWIR